MGGGESQKRFSRQQRIIQSEVSGFHGKQDSGALGDEGEGLLADEEERLLLPPDLVVDCDVGAALNVLQAEDDLRAPVGDNSEIRNQEEG